MQFAVKLSIVLLCLFFCSFILCCNLSILQGQKSVWVLEVLKKTPTVKQLTVCQCAYFWNYISCFLKVTYFKLKLMEQSFSLPSKTLYRNYWVFEFVRHILLAYLLYAKLFPVLKCLISIHLKDGAPHIDLLLQKNLRKWHC